MLMVMRMVVGMSMAVRVRMSMMLMGMGLFIMPIVVLWLVHSFFSLLDRVSTVCIIPFHTVSVLCR